MKLDNLYRLIPLTITIIITKVLNVSITPQNILMLFCIFLFCFVCVWYSFLRLHNMKSILSTYFKVYNTMLLTLSTV